VRRVHAARCPYSHVSQQQPTQDRNCSRSFSILAVVMVILDANRIVSSVINVTRRYAASQGKTMRRTLDLDYECHRTMVTRVEIDRTRRRSATHLTVMRILAAAALLAVTLLALAVDGAKVRSTPCTSAIHAHSHRVALARCRVRCDRMKILTRALSSLCRAYRSVPAASCPPRVCTSAGRLRIDTRREHVCFDLDIGTIECIRRREAYARIRNEARCIRRAPR
jgi:hypothetical protein